LSKTGGSAYGGEQLSFLSRMRTKVDDIFNINLDGKTVKVWHSRRFNELFFMHIPRFFFLAGGIYTIYIINVR